MGWDDHRPPNNFPGTSMVARLHNNRYGSALVAIYRFMAALEQIRSNQGATSRDSFSCILFNSDTTVGYL
jgi:hypothetical protein